MIAANAAAPFLKFHRRWRRLGWHAVTGFLFGYVVLHSLSMLIFQWLDPRMAEAMPNHRAAGSLLAAAVHSFQPDMLPMGLVFGLVGAAIATFYGYHRLAVSFQRDRLAQELARNEKLRGELAVQNEELAALELANRRTTQFMAHDFKTALNCVGGFAGQLLAKPGLRDDREVAEALTCIRRQAHRMTGAVLDLLQLARMGEKGKPSVQRLSVTEVLHEAVGDFSLPAHAARIGLGDRHRRCPPLCANRDLLRRVLCNLVSNAIKHNGPNTRVCVDAEVSESGREVLFSCRDDGAGIPPEVLPLLFRKFAPAKEFSHGSSGLGLAFCKAAVEAHWGRIWCENLPQGSQFCFTIPLDKEHSHDQCIYDI